MKDLITAGENEIGKLIGSSAYQNSAYPSHKAIHQKVRDWFSFQYGRQPVETDATGRMIAPTAKKTSFFISQIQQGNILFVGEGNLSFALSIAKISGISASKLVATTYEKDSDLSEEAQQNAEILKQSGASVLNGATPQNWINISPIRNSTPSCSNSPMPEVARPNTDAIPISSSSATFSKARLPAWLLMAES